MILKKLLRIILIYQFLFNLVKDIFFEQNSKKKQKKTLFTK